MAPNIDPYGEIAEFISADYYKLEEILRDFKYSIEQGEAPRRYKHHYIWLNETLKEFDNVQASEQGNSGT